MVTTLRIAAGFLVFVGAESLVPLILGNRDDAFLAIKSILACSAAAIAMLALASILASVRRVEAHLAEIIAQANR